MCVDCIKTLHHSSIKGILGALEPPSPPLLLRSCVSEKPFTNYLSASSGGINTEKGASCNITLDNTPPRLLTSCFLPPSKSR